MKALSIRQPWIEGPACIVLGEVVALERPVRCRGRLSLWTVPDGVLADVVCQLDDELLAAIASC